MKQKLKNGYEIRFRDVQLSDADILIDYMNKVINETSNLLREPDEFTLTKEQEEVFIQRVLDSDSDAMILAFHNNLLVATAGIHGSALKKIKHKVEFGISVLQDYQNLGIGSIMMEEVIKKAKRLNKIKIELEVRNDNQNAIHVYEKYGFITEGIKEKGFYTNKKFYDLRQMALFLEE